MTTTVPGRAHDPAARRLTAWWQRPEPDRPAWRTRAGPPYPAGDPFLFAALEVGRWPVPVREVAPNGGLRLRIETASGLFAGMERRIMAAPLWGLEPEPRSRPDGA